MSCGDGQSRSSAQYGRGKTPLLAHMALEAACSAPLTPLGLSTCRSPIVVLDGESNPASYRAMFKRLMCAASVEEWPQALRFWFKLDQGLTPGSPSFDNLTRLVASCKPGLVILDPLRQFASGYDLTKTRDALTFMNSLRALQAEAQGLRLTLSHHLTKRDLGADHVALADDPWAWLERFRVRSLFWITPTCGWVSRKKTGSSSFRDKARCRYCWPCTTLEEDEREAPPIPLRGSRAQFGAYAEFLKQPDTFPWKTASNS